MQLMLLKGPRGKVSPHLRTIIAHSCSNRARLCLAPDAIPLLDPCWLNTLYLVYLRGQRYPPFCPTHGHLGTLVFTQCSFLAQVGFLQDWMRASIWTVPLRYLVGLRDRSGESHAALFHNLHFTFAFPDGQSRHIARRSNQVAVAKVAHFCNRSRIHHARLRRHRHSWHVRRHCPSIRLSSGNTPGLYWYGAEDLFLRGPDCVCGRARDDYVGHAFLPEGATRPSVPQVRLASLRLGCPVSQPPSPACIISFFVVALARGEFNDAWNWSDEVEEKTDKPAVGAETNGKSADAAPKSVISDQLSVKDTSAAPDPQEDDVSDTPDKKKRSKKKRH